MNPSLTARLALLSAVLAPLLAAAPALAAPVHEDAHAHHAGHAPDRTYQRSIRSYRVPDVTLVDHEGDALSLAALLADDGPVMLNFIFTSCTAICPVMSATFANARRQLGGEADAVRMVSISNDPEHDTPPVLKAYAARYGAHPEWHFLTGEPGDIRAVLRAFDAYQGGKMNHRPVTLLRASRSSPWVRIEGLTTAAELVREFRLLARE